MMFMLTNIVMDIILIYVNLKKILEHLDLTKKIRLTIDCWNEKVPRTNSLMENTELSSICKVGIINYTCHDLLNLTVSVVHPCNILSESSSHIGKIKDIYKHLDLVNIFYISYSQVEYNIISARHFEILFEYSNRKTNYRKHLKSYKKKRYKKK